MAGTIIGYVRNDLTLTGISGATILQYVPSSNPVNQATSASNGYYSIDVPDGTITLRTTKNDPANSSCFQQKDVTVTANNNIVVKDILMHKKTC